MKLKLHLLVQKTKIELQRLDKKERLTWEEQKEYNSNFLPISVAPKLRPRALKFMNDLILQLEANSHNIKFYINRCHIEKHQKHTQLLIK